MILPLITRVIVIFIVCLILHHWTWVANYFVACNIKACEATVEHNVYVYWLVHVVVVARLVVVHSILPATANIELRIETTLPLCWFECFIFIHGWIHVDHLWRWTGAHSLLSYGCIYWKGIAWREQMQLPKWSWVSFLSLMIGVPVFRISTIILTFTIEIIVLLQSNFV